MKKEQQEKLNPIAKSMFLDALRSRAYKQCRGQLKCADIENGYCAEGLLQLCYHKATNTEWAILGPTAPGSLLSVKVLEWAGITRDPLLMVQGKLVSLWTINDCRPNDGREIKGPFSFKEIAVMVENQL